MSKFRFLIFFISVIAFIPTLGAIWRVEAFAGTVYSYRFAAYLLLLPLIFLYSAVRIYSSVKDLIKGQPVVRKILILDYFSIAFAFFSIFANFSCGFESYCILYPDIDTRYSSEYVENNFQSIEIGFSEAQVLRLLGEPLDKYQAPESTQSIWHYTTDGACSRWCDAAWFGRSLYFENGKVIGKWAQIAYD